MEKGSAMDEPEAPVRPGETKWPVPEDDGDRQLLSDVRSFGWHLIGIEADDEGPAFAYTVGLYHSFGHPEFVVFGLPVTTLFGILNALSEAVKAGDRFCGNEETDRALDDLNVQLREVDPACYREYLGYARWLYASNDFPVLQCIWPDSRQYYPTEAGFDPRLSGLQPLLAAKHPWPFHVGTNRVAIITRAALDEGRPFLRVYHDADGEWQFLGGTPFAPEDGRLVSLETALKLDPSLTAVADLPRDSHAFRCAPDKPWRWNECPDT